MRLMLFLLGILFACSCSENPTADKSVIPLTGKIEKLHPDLDAVLDTSAKVEIIAEGFEWSEGPLWLEKEQMLIFSDVPRNRIYKWTEAKGKEIYLEPSGYTDAVKRGGETGSNGLLLDKNGRLILCQHGNRQVAIMEAPVDSPKAIFKTLGGTFQGKKFNSPNDAVINKEGEIFFTDPPYGLEKNVEDPTKEITFQGVYKIKTSGEVVLVADSLTRPNGISLSTDERTLFVANSDPAKATWYAFTLNGNDSVSGARIFYDATRDAKSEKGLPDGMKTDKMGRIFATGPGGIWILSATGQLLGKIKFPEATSNVALSADEKTLYVTADMYVWRMKMRK